MVPDSFFLGYLSPGDRCAPPRLALQVWKKGVRHHLCEAPSGPLGQMVPDPLFTPGSATGSKRNRGFDQALFQRMLQAEAQLLTDALHRHIVRQDVGRDALQLLGPRHLEDEPQ